MRSADAIAAGTDRRPIDLAPSLLNGSIVADTAFLWTSRFAYGGRKNDFFHGNETERNRLCVSDYDTFGAVT